MRDYSLAINTISVCWIIFIMVWLVSAASTKRTVYRESTAQRLRYWVLLVIALLLLIFGWRLPRPLNLRIIPPWTPVSWAGAVLCVAGLAFALWARFTLGRNWSGLVTLKEGHELIERGPYRLVRHPIYTGILSMFLATALVRGHVAEFIGVTLLFLSFWIKLASEEQLMLKQFPNRYAAYQRRTSRIIPFVL